MEHPFRITYAELLAMGLHECRTTLMCVSNEVGGGLISTATWLGVPIRDLLARARPKAGADMVLSTGADGFTASSPLTALHRRPERDPARRRHERRGAAERCTASRCGWSCPASTATSRRRSGSVRSRSPATRGDARYWTNRGWSREGPGEGVEPDRRARAVASRRASSRSPGVAWAQHTGIARVQLQIDDGPVAGLRARHGEASVDVWRQWKYRWTAERGTHTLRVARRIERRR